MRKEGEKKMAFESMCSDCIRLVIEDDKWRRGLVESRSPPLNHDKLSMDLVRSCISQILFDRGDG
jgi:hypothetical protein